jgi:hypothetical protein
VDGLMYIRIEIFLKETSYGEFAGRKKISWQRRLRQIRIVFKFEFQIKSIAMSILFI